MGLRAFTLAIAVLAYLGWVTFLANQSRIASRALSRRPRSSANSEKSSIHVSEITRDLKGSL